VARPGPAPIPNENKRLRGNPGHRALPKPLTLIAPAAVQIIGPATDGDALIRALLDGPARAWIAEPDRLGILELLRQAWDERIRLRAIAADLEPGWETGRYQPAVLVRLAVVEKDVTGWLSLLGLTPSDRSRLGVAEVRAQSNLNALRDRRAVRLNRGHAG
jgi:hypothetical protein